MKFLTKILLTLLVILSAPVMTLGGLAQFRIVSPLIVISGSMEPEIHVGSLIISTTVRAKDLQIGDIASIKRDDGVLVTHRVISNEPLQGSTEVRSIKMKGDANNVEDKNPYVQSDALRPLFIIPAIGSTLAYLESWKYGIITLFSFGTGLLIIFNLLRRLTTNKFFWNKKTVAAEETENIPLDK